MKPVFGNYSDLTEDERRILDNSKVTVGRGKNAHTLSGQQLYDYMTVKKNGMQKQLAGFLNQTAGLADIKFSNGRNALSWYCQLNFMKTQDYHLRQDESPFVIWLINNRLDADRLFPSGDPRFHHCSVSASSVQMSSHSEV